MHRTLATFIRRNALVIASLVMAAALLGAALAYPDASRQEAVAEPVSAKGSLADYSWEELSRISQELSRCPTEEDAIACACRYGLCAPDGSLDDYPAKSVELLGGGQVPVALIGVWQDDRTDGGKAGLTFMFEKPVGTHAMNHAFESADGDNADSVGGWAATDMRAWLNGDFLYELPADLRSRIASVQKPSANATNGNDELDEPGRLAGSADDWSSETTDTLWLLSASELCGSVPPQRDLGVDSTMASVYAAEGAQYRLFADWNVKAFRANGHLAVAQDGDAQDDDACGGQTGDTTTWWLRTKTLEFGDGFWLVGTDGSPLNGLGEDERIATDASFAPDELWGPDHARAVLPCFCL